MTVVVDRDEAMNAARAAGGWASLRVQAVAMNDAVRAAGYRSPQRPTAPEPGMTLPPDHPAAVLGRRRAGGRTWHRRLTERAMAAAATRAALPAELSASLVARFAQELDAPRSANSVQAARITSTVTTVDADDAPILSLTDDSVRPDDTGNPEPPPARSALTTTVLTAAPPRRRARTPLPA